MDIIELINLLYSMKYIQLLNKLELYRYETTDKNIYFFIEDLLWLYYFDIDMCEFKRECIKLIKYIYKKIDFKINKDVISSNKGCMTTR